MFGSRKSECMPQDLVAGKGQLNSEWVYEVIVSSEIPSKNYRDFGTRSLLEGRAEISVIFLGFWKKQCPHKFILNLTDL